MLIWVIDTSLIRSTNLYQATCCHQWNDRPTSGCSSWE